MNYVLYTVWQAYNYGLYGKHVVFIIYNWFAVDWWKTSPSCTPDEMLQVVDGAIYIGRFHF